MRAMVVATALSMVCSGCTPNPPAAPAAPSASPQPEPAPAQANAKPYQGRSLEVFVGSASKPATEQAVEAFQALTGAEVLAQYGGSGQMLSQMKLTGRGDIYFPGSSDYMELAKRDQVVVPETEKIVVYLVPAINVPKGNPAHIHGLADLARKGVRVGIARPDAVCVGLYAVEVLEHAGLSEKVRPNIVTQAESCEKTAQLVALDTVDAVMGWEVFQYWQPEKIETVLLPKDQVSRIGYIPIAVATSAKEPELAQAFIDFLTGEAGRHIFAQWHYMVSEEEARRFALPSATVGGEWRLPKSWQ